MVRVVDQAVTDTQVDQVEAKICDEKGSLNFPETTSAGHEPSSSPGYLSIYLCGYDIVGDSYCNYGARCNDSPNLIDVICSALGPKGPHKYPP